MKKFTVNCDFGGQMSPFAIYIGKPEGKHHPLHFQADWLSKNRGGVIPDEVMEAVTQLQELAEKNGVSLEELCVYALGTEEQQLELEEKDHIKEAEEPEVSEGVEDQQRYEVETQGRNTIEEEAEEMASEGGHIEEESPEIDETKQEKK